MSQMKASLINMRLTSRYSTESYAFAVKGFCLLFSAFRIRSGTQFHGCTDLSTLCRDKSHTYLPSPKSFVCNLQDSGRHVTSVFQGLSLSRSIGRVGENPGNEVDFSAKAANSPGVQYGFLYNDLVRTSFISRLIPSLVERRSC